jgi:hypothetical protein
MSLEEKMSKANSLGSAISVWTRIIIGAIVFIGTCFLAYNQIWNNSDAITRVSGNIHEVRKLVEKDLDVYSARSDKRYKRAMETADKLEKKCDKLERMVINLIEDNAYLKGKIQE